MASNVTLHPMSAIEYSTNPARHRVHIKEDIYGKKFSATNA